MMAEMWTILIENNLSGIHVFPFFNDGKIVCQDLRVLSRQGSFFEEQYLQRGFGLDSDLFTPNVTEAMRL